MNNFTKEYNGVSNSEVSKFKNRCWEDFVAAFTEVKNLFEKFESTATDLCEIIKICPIEYLKFFMVALTRRVVFVMARCKMLLDGKCLRKHQTESESNYLLTTTEGDLKGSYEKDQQNRGFPYPLTKRSVDAMKYLGVATATANDIRECDLDNK